MQARKLYLAMYSHGKMQYVCLFFIVEVLLQCLFIKVSGASNTNSNSNKEEFTGAKCSRICMYHVQKGNIDVALEGKALWDEFFHRGTEMIVNRAGRLPLLLLFKHFFMYFVLSRRMFPGFSVSISSLKPKVKYSMKLEVVLADNHRFKFLNSRWLAVGSAEPQPLSESYLHPDSPNSGAFWMRHGVSFRKLKITNNKEKPGSNASTFCCYIIPF